MLSLKLNRIRGLRLPVGVIGMALFVDKGTLAVRQKGEYDP
jgi:hypothetical protein